MNAHDDGAARLATWECHAGDVSFEVTAPQPWAARQCARLAEFLPGPPRELELHRFTMTVTIDDMAFHDVMREVAADPDAVRIEPIPTVVLLEARRPGDRRCYAVAADGLEHRAGDYVVTATADRIELFLHRGSTGGHRYPLRLMREAMLRTYEDAGGVIFHAAGVDLGGNGVMICGPRAAGKTTTLACLLRRPNAALLSNDRLILHGDRLIAVPLPVPTASGTIHGFPELTHAPRPASGGHRKPPAAFGTTAKHPFSAAGFAAAFGAGLASASTVRLIVVPRLSDDTVPAHTRRLTTGQAHELLAASCFTPHDEFWVRPWLVPRQRSDASLAQAAEAAVEHIAATVPCVEVRCGVRNPISHLSDALAEVVGGIR